MAFQKNTGKRAGGLTGKARKAHYRKRAALHHSQRMINEFCDSQSSAEPPDRFIPIGARSEFLPSAVESNLTLVENQKNQTASPPSSPPTHAAIRFPRRSESGSKVALKPPLQFRPKQGFTVGGFLLGCAMGSAAALFALVVIHVAVG